MELQRDFFVELEDAKRITSMEMQAIANRLPAADILTATDVAGALSVNVATVYALIQSGRLPALNVGSKDRPHYKLVRASLLKYLQDNIQ